MGSLKACWLQVGITSMLTWLGWMATAGQQPEEPKARLIIAAVIGFGGNYLLMKLYVLIRYGWNAMRSMRLYGND